MEATILGQRRGTTGGGLMAGLVVFLRSVMNQKGGGLPMFHDRPEHLYLILKYLCGVVLIGGEKRAPRVECENASLRDMFNNVLRRIFVGQQQMATFDRSRNDSNALHDVPLSLEIRIKMK